MISQSTSETLADSLEIYKAVFETSPDPIIVLDDCSKIIIGNKKAEQLFGYEKEDMVGKEIERFIPDWSLHSNTIEGRGYSGEVGRDTWAKRKDGSNVSVEINLNRILVLQRTLISVVARDITERNEQKKKSSENEIEFTNTLNNMREGAMEFKRVEKQLEEAIASTKNAYNELEQFTYIISHDLQEPLRMITSFLNLLKSETNEKLDDSEKEFIHFAVDGAERMKVMIQDLLKYSRVGTDKEDFSLVDLNKVVEYVIQVLRKDIEKNKVDVKLQQLPVIRGNKTLITQLFMNLIANAVKYRRKENPEIRIENIEDTDKWTFCVRDNGIGIDPKFFEKIFVIFQRLHTRAEYLGTGIGLAICKKTVEKHGGSIWVESEPGKGSTFFFTIPKQL